MDRVLCRLAALLGGLLTAGCVSTELGSSAIEEQLARLRDSLPAQPAVLLRSAALERWATLDLPRPSVPTRAHHLLPADPARLAPAAEPASEPATTELASAPVAPEPAPDAPLHAAPATALAPESPTPWLLAALGREVPIYAEARAGARQIGYLRLGATVPRLAESVGASGCRGGWYAIRPEGFVCAGRFATVDPEHPLIKAASVPPDRTESLPYVYGMSRGTEPVLYARAPGPSAATSATQPKGSWRDIALDPLLPAAIEQARVNEPAVLGRSVARSSFAFTGFFEHGGKHYGVTPELAVLALDQVERVVASRFHGLPLDAATPLPVAFTRGGSTVLYAGSPDAGLRPVRTLSGREALPLSGRSAKVGRATFWETRDQHWIPGDQLIRVEPRQTFPRAAERGEKWLDVSLAQQVLVAYRGKQPEFVTLVSTGADGMGDPAETRSTIQGQFRIHTKHVTATMDSDVAGDEYDMRDVPYVQYFTQGYALHAAFWHDAFGTPKSHGCINLSPADARFLFHWTDPPVPHGWHAALSVTRGTLIDIHP